MNLSPQGLFVRASATSLKDSLRITMVLAVGRPLVFSLRIAGDASPYEAKGRVAWRSDLGVGVDFVEVGEPLRHFIERLCEAGDGAPALVESIEPDPVIDVA